MLKHTKITWNKLNSKLGKGHILEYFHEIQLDVSKYTKYHNWYVCSHYKYHLSHVFLLN